MKRLKWASNPNIPKASWRMKSIYWMINSIQYPLWKKKMRSKSISWGHCYTDVTHWRRRHVTTQHSASLTNCRFNTYYHKNPLLFLMFRLCIHSLYWLFIINFSSIAMLTIITVSKCASIKHGNTNWFIELFRKYTYGNMWLIFFIWIIFDPIIPRLVSFFINQRILLMYSWNIKTIITMIRCIDIISYINASMIISWSYSSPMNSIG